MAGRPAGYSDEENDSENYDYYDNTNCNLNSDELPAAVVEQTKDPWSSIVFGAVKDQNKMLTGSETEQFLENSGGYEYDINSISSFLKCLEEGNVEVLKTLWLDSSKDRETGTNDPKKRPLKGDKIKNNTYLNYAFNELGGARPIMVACRFGQPRVVKLLVDLGASLAPDSYDGLTPLMSLCGSEVCSSDDNIVGDFDNRICECAKILINDGNVEVNAKQNQQITALMLAAKRGHSEIVNILISKGAELNAMDSQRWTALCFAVDAQHGHVARILLEAGADPDIATQEGIVAADLANTSEDSMLLDIILKFSKNRSKLFAPDLLENKGKDKLHCSVTDSNSLEYKKYSELDFVLLGIDAKEYLPHFEAHGVTLDYFLALNESDLEKIGVDKVGVRKKMLTAISEIHKRNWEKTSLPVIKTVDKQKGIYYTCPDAVLMIANISDHFKYIRANVEHLRKNISDCPELLRIGQDVANLSDLNKRAAASKASIIATSKEISRLQSVLEGLSNDPRFRPVDLISDNTININSKKSYAKILICSVAFLGGMWGIYKYGNKAT
jgi:ankyrin repeat/SAM/basic leucine zipper domain-containing protein 1